MPKTVPPIVEALRGALDKHPDKPEAVYHVLRDPMDTSGDDDRSASDLHQQLVAAFLGEDEGPESSPVAVYKLLEDLKDWCLVEDAIRRAGFVAGFAHACRMLTGIGMIGGAK